MACAEVTTPDKLFQIIARRLNDAKDEARADVRVGQHKYVTDSVTALIWAKNRVPVRS